MLFDHQIRGTSNELECMAAFIKMGFIVSIPYGDCSRYDFIADNGQMLLKVQCKASQWVDDTQSSFIFPCRSAHINSKGVKFQKYTKDQIDYFATFFNGKCYVVTVEECSTCKTLRYGSTKSGQKKGVCNAEDYEISKFLGVA